MKHFCAREIFAVIQHDPSSSPFLSSWLLPSLSSWLSSTFPPQAGFKSSLPTLWVLEGGLLFKMDLRKAKMLLHECSRASPTGSRLLATVASRACLKVHPLAYHLSPLWHTCVHPFVTCPGSPFVLPALLRRPSWTLRGINGGFGMGQGRCYPRGLG